MMPTLKPAMMLLTATSALAMMLMMYSHLTIRGVMGVVNERSKTASNSAAAGWLREGGVGGSGVSME